uniref:FHA domain-containing protein n=3 Tax=Parascaris TaxID=6254 RepID=A0A915AXV5_PARUN
SLQRIVDDYPRKIPLSIMMEIPTQLEDTSTHDGDASSIHIAECDSSTHLNELDPSIDINDSDSATFRQPDSSIPLPLHTVTSSKKDAGGDDSTPSMIPNLDYKPPPWAVEPSSEYIYGVDVIKSGMLIESIPFSRRAASTYVVVGRLPVCDIHLDHPSISRYHCILQYGEDIMDRRGKGWHIYDLGSTHGTKLNKQMLASKQYVRIRVGHVMQFGGSSRIMVLTGPPSDSEKEWEYSPTEMRKMRERKKLEQKLRKEAEKIVLSEKTTDDEGISWGMEYDEDQAYAQTIEGDIGEEREAAYRDDPLKALSHFFDREGFDMEFSFSESGTAHNHKWTCYIELPVDTAAGQSLSATATCSGSKKEAQNMCALNACHILDTHGVLYRSRNETRKKAKDLAENDFYDSDEDVYFDRTGQIERSRESRRKRALEAKGESTEVKETYESLLKKIMISNEEVQRIEKRLEVLSSREENIKAEEGDDELDTYCKNLQQSTSAGDNIDTKVEKSNLRQRLVELKHEMERLEKLAKIAKPVALPALKTNITATSSSGMKRATGMVSAATMNKLLMLRRSKAAASREKAKGHEMGMQPPPTDIPFVAEFEEEDEQIPETSEEKTKAIKYEQPLGASNIEQQSEAQMHDRSETKRQHIVQEPVVSLQKLQSSNPPRPINVSREEVDEPPSSVIKKAVEEEKEAEQHETSDGCGIDSRDAVVKRKRMRIRGERMLTKAPIETGEYGEGCPNRDEEYATWMPPEDQCGDGTTSLNAKFAGRY